MCERNTGTERPSAAVRRYFARRRTRGKSVLARALDAAILFLVGFVACFLYLVGKGIRVRHALLLSAVTVLFFAVLYRMIAEYRLQCFIPLETERISREILRRRMPFMERETVQKLCERVAGRKEVTVFCTAEPVSADILLPYLKSWGEDPRIFCATAGFTETAKKLAAGCRVQTKLIGAEPVLDAAMRDSAFRPDIAAVYEQIESEEAERKQRRKKASAFPLNGNIGRYLAAAGLLLLFSFRTGFSLYYRMLASLCIGIAVLRLFLQRDMHTGRTV